ncbi:antirestriction protein ArdA [Hyphomonas atlantica corrig.]|uniref:antirestriction protein ArdA n=3 Tax=Hyphomonas TaxID=85 RepID=UPI0023558425|nr:antirestriction protein ArdA [Hyphomonas atlantica]
MTPSHETPAPLGTATGPDLRDTPRIYVACLAAYNNGRLHGAWIDATEPDEMMQGVRAMLAASPEPGAEEWSIHGATRKSHLLSEAGMPLVEPSRPFLAGACELGNRLVRSLRKRAGSWQPHAGEPPKEKTGMVNESESVLMRRYPSVPRKWLLRGAREWAGGTWIPQSEGRYSPAYSRHLTRSHLTDAELSNPDEVRSLATAFGKRLARAAQLLSGCRKLSEANAASRKARGIHNPADRAMPNLKGC